MPILQVTGLLQLLSCTSPCAPAQGMHWPEMLRLVDTDHSESPCSCSLCRNAQQ